MEKISGLVLEVNDRNCLVLAPGNRYVKLRLPEKKPQPGDFIEGYPLNARWNLGARSVSRVWAYVASVLIMVLFGSYQVYASVAPAAYVSLDSSPSVELVLNSRGKVIKTNSYNSEGRELLNKTPVENLTANQAVQALLNAMTSPTGSQSPTTAAVLTYTDSPALNGTDLSRIVLQTLRRKHYQGQVLTDVIDNRLRQRASSAQLSSGQQLVWELAKSKRLPLDLKELLHNSLDRVLNEHHLQLTELIDTHAKVDQHSPRVQQIQSTPDTLSPNQPPLGSANTSAQPAKSNKHSTQNNWPGLAAIPHPESLPPGFTISGDEPKALGAPWRTKDAPQVTSESNHSENITVPQANDYDPWDKHPDNENQHGGNNDGHDKHPNAKTDSKNRSDD